MIIDTMLKDKNVIGELVFKIDVDTKMFEAAFNKVKAQYKAELDKSEPFDVALDEPGNITITNATIARAFTCSRIYGLNAHKG